MEEGTALKLAKAAAGTTAWASVGHGLTFAIATQFGNPHAQTWAIASAALLSVLAYLGVLPGSERKPKVDLDRCLTDIGRMFYQCRVDDQEYARLRAQCIDAFERAQHK